ncbi:MAG: DUF2288 domain-containing protein [Proteobacteria bacterium]|nr:DUF2288 domain-containing protein [Pseudomonadota bacterium]
MNQEDVGDCRNLFQQEMAEISYLELQKFFAKGVLLIVHKDVDMVETAMAIHQDNAKIIQQMMSDQTLIRAHDDHASLWYRKKSSLMALTVAPWVLVQTK